MDLCQHSQGGSASSAQAQAEAAAKSSGSGSSSASAQAIASSLAQVQQLGCLREPGIKCGEPTVAGHHDQDQTPTENHRPET